MTGFDHTDWANTDWSHASFSPYEPDTDGTEVQVDPASFDPASFDLASFAADPTVAAGADDVSPLSPLYGTEDGAETLTVWSTSADGNAGRESGEDFAAR
jgi:hypothetical protein